MSENVESVPSPRVDDGQAVNLALNELLDCVIQTVAGVGGGGGGGGMCMHTYRCTWMTSIFTSRPV